jgi:hypothetical protein
MGDLREIGSENAHHNKPNLGCGQNDTPLIGDLKESTKFQLTNTKQLRKTLQRTSGSSVWDLVIGISPERGERRFKYVRRTPLLISPTARAL